MSTLSRLRLFVFARAISVLAALLLMSAPGRLLAGSMLEITELLSHPEQYDRQMVVVVGRVSNFQIATNRQGQLAYGFLLKDVSGTVKVVGLGKADVREGDQVIVEGIFSRLRQTGRTIVYNEIKASVVRPLDRLNPDLVG
ncbi:MAG: cytochrome c maturation protein CcmE [Nitrospirae bacterium]|nr:cytochrome c maturation protein CcmE [Nitrospirota bacterium]